MLEEIVSKYFPKNEVVSILPFGNGHINDTYKLDLVGISGSYILQRINTNVFKNPQGIIHNHLLLQNSVFHHPQNYSIPKLIPNCNGSYLTFDNDGKVWRLTDFIAKSYTIDVVEEAWQAYESGSAFGWFAKACNVLNPNDFKEAINDFHRLSFRLMQLNEAIENDKVGRLHRIIDVINFYEQRGDKLLLIENLVDNGIIPLRVVHNDTKINNLLFKGNKAVAIIDLDTLGPGILYFDYGDAIRTCANTAKEDEQDLTRVDFNLDAFKEFSRGYLGQVKTIVGEEEKSYFYLAPILLSYIMGIRFLADYLNGDEYYKTSYPDHNLVRSKVQMALIESMEKREDEMKTMIDVFLSNIWLQ